MIITFPILEFPVSPRYLCRCIILFVYVKAAHLFDNGVFILFCFPGVCWYSHGKWVYSTRFCFVSAGIQNFPSGRRLLSCGEGCCCCDVIKRWLCGLCWWVSLCCRRAVNGILAGFCQWCSSSDVWVRGYSASAQCFIHAVLFLLALLQTLTVLNDIDWFLIHWTFDASLQ